MKETGRKITASNAVAILDETMQRIPSCEPSYHAWKRVRQDLQIQAWTITIQGLMIIGFSIGLFIGYLTH